MLLCYSFTTEEFFKVAIVSWPEWEMYIYIYMTSSSYNHTLNGNTKWQVMRIYHELRLKSNLIQF